MLKFKNKNMEKEKIKKIVTIISLIVIIVMSFTRMFLDEIYHGGGVFEDAMGRPFEVEGCFMSLIELFFVIPWAIILLIDTVRTQKTDYTVYWFLALIFFVAKCIMLFDTESGSPCPVDDHGLLRMFDLIEMIPIIIIAIISLVKRKSA